MPLIAFNRGISEIEKINKKTILTMAFHPMNKEFKVYRGAERSLPKVKGLVKRIKRMEFAYEFVEAMKAKGIKISV